jgi:hypothetical protein
MSRNCLRAASLASALLLSGCSEISKTPETQGKADAATREAAVPPVPVSGKTAYWEMYKSARNWAKDLIPLSLESKEVPGIQNQDGKAAMWTATVASPGLKEARVFTYSIVAHPPDIYKGVTVGGALPWNGPSSQAMPFQMSQVAVDSDVAYQAALADAGAWLKKHPGKQASLNLHDSARFQVPTWYVLWGDPKLGYRSLVNGMNGAAITNK